jgi:hypothetical protein
MGIFSKTTLQHIWLMQPWLQYGKCLKTEKSAEACALQDPQISVFAIFIIGETLRKIYKNNTRSTEALQNDNSCNWFNFHGPTSESIA